MWYKGSLWKLQGEVSLLLKSAPFSLTSVRSDINNVTYTEISFKGNNTKIKNCNCCKGQVRIANYFTEPSCFFCFFYNLNEEFSFTNNGNSSTKQTEIARLWMKTKSCLVPNVGDSFYQLAFIRFIMFIGKQKGSYFNCPKLESLN